MSENDYEYQCMRAELLGLPKPEKTEIQPNSEQCEDENSGNNVGVDDLELDVDAERFNRTSGGLDEISNILQTTQKKINRFKTVFGSVTSLLKGRGSVEGSTENLRGSNSNINEGGASIAVDNEATKNNGQNSSSDEKGMDDNSSGATRTQGVSSAGSARKADVESMLSSHIQTLDSMVYKADQINASMNHQNKQMRNFLNK